MCCNYFNVNKISAVHYLLLTKLKGGFLESSSISLLESYYNVNKPVLSCVKLSTA